jgi:hypothetical protein
MKWFEIVGWALAFTTATAIVLTGIIAMIITG